MTKERFVVELASNDGYLLQYFVKTGIPCLGVEPAANVAKAAEERGVKTQVAFFNVDTAKEMKAAGKMADLVLGNNVLAQVPDLNSFVGGLPIILKPKGTVTFEFPHLMQLFENNQFDTIYHEHFSYFSLIAVEAIFARHGLTIFDVEELWTHGGSLRIFARHAADDSRPVTERLLALRAREEEKGLPEDRDLHALRGARTGDEAQDPRGAHRREAARQAHRRVRGAGQGKHAPQLLQHPYGFHRLHRRSQSLQARPVPARDAYPDFPAGAPRPGQARLRLHSPLESQGRDHGAAQPRPRLGGPLHRPDSRTHGGLMLSLSFGAGSSEPLRILCLGAHSDDIEIGCGGTVLRLLEDRPGSSVHWVVLSATADREREARASAEDFLSRAGRASVNVKSFRESFFPTVWSDIKSYFEEIKRDVTPDVVLCHRTADLHQDHRVVAELTWNTFRNHLVLEYEIAKYEGDLGSPNVYVPLSKAVADRKVDLLMKHFGSQSKRTWFRPDTFNGLMSIRGIESNAPEGRAEAFHARKIVV